MFRIGFGYDVHRLREGRPLILGGVHIPHNQGLDGHSDADVLIHAVMDAIIGALGIGDIGMHFPDTDPAHKDRDSISMLREVAVYVKAEELCLNNLDITVVAQRPKLAPFTAAMRDRMAEALEAAPDQINIKATTTEGLGFSGREEGISSFAVVSLVGRSDDGIDRHDRP